MPSRRHWVRAALVGCLAALLALIGLHAYNFMHLDLAAMRAGAEPLLARARQINERARPEYQELALARLPPNAHNGPFYRFDNRLHEADIVGGPAQVATPDATIVHSFEFDGSADQELVAADNGAAQRLENGVLKVVGHNGSDYFTNATPLALPRDGVGDIVVRARASENTRMTLAWSKKDKPDDVWQNSFEISLLGDDQFHTYVINGRNALKRGLGPGERLARLFIRPADTAGTDIEIDFVRFLSNRARYLTARNGVLFETLGGEMRKALYMLPPQALEWTVDVPQQSPKLDVGNAVLLDHHPVNFGLSVVAGNDTAVLHNELMSDASGWRDYRFDLSAWAGRQVKLRLEVAGDPENVALWSSPILYSDPGKQLNVIILLEDALRADYLSSYGYERATSPNKTALVQARGIQFDWAISQATETRPSVPSLMTSLYPTATGVWHSSDMLSDRHLTLAEILRAQGFITASFVQNGNAGLYAGLHQGFDRLYDEDVMGQKSEEILGPRVRAWLERHADQNFFLYLHVIDPHGPYDPDEPFDDWYRDAAGSGAAVPFESRYEPDSIGQPTDEGRRARYAGEIRRNDALLPNLMKMLEDFGLAEDTLLILLSDHGEYMGEGGHWGHHPPGLMPVTRVPLMMVYPRRFREAKRIAAPVGLIDVMPTVLDVAEVEPTDLLMQGDSLLDLIESQEPMGWHNRLVVSEEPAAMHKQQPCRCASLVRGDWHVISSARLWPNRGSRMFPTLAPFLNTRAYKFRVDPTERAEVLSAVPDLYLRWVASAIFSELQDTNIATQQKLTEGENVDLQLDPDTLEHLKGLGYVN